ncbi:hypothetical protein LTR08_006274 [Meristemomyces frigidus]|nr:hypothetical protein LTR08_006274 [Meristemomyces frigidus]
MSTPLPVTTGYYEQQPTYSSFGALQAPSYPQTASNRLPSVTTDAFSSLNSMGSLHSSLPAQTAQERRLPAPVAPYTLHYPQPPYPTGEQLPEIRPGSYSEPRVHLNGIHSRNAMPWSSESGPVSSRPALSSNNMAPINGLPGPPMLQQQRQPQHNAQTPVTESVLGYQFGHNANLSSINNRASPEILPTSGPSLESFSSTASSSSSTASMPPPHPNFRYAQPLPAASNSTASDERTSSHRESVAAASLYSFSTDTGERPATSRSCDQQGSTLSTPVPSSHHNYTSGGLRQPQPQHVASADALRRQSSSDQQRAATAHRMSVSNLNGRYG